MQDMRVFRRKRGCRRVCHIVAAAALVAAATGQPVFAQQLVPAEAVLGFEDLSAWRISASLAGSTSVVLTGIRTQGAAAYAVDNPAKLTVLTSAALSSTSAGLAGIGVPGAKVAIDVRLPATGRLGSLLLFVTSASCGLNAVPLGVVSFGDLRPNTFQTVSFPVTEFVRRRLARAAFADLRFVLTLALPRATGQYVMDNLRVRAVQGVTTDASTQVPDGYGGSVDFDVSGDPMGNPFQEHTFDVGPIQVPARLHLKAGAVRSSRAQLDLGYGPAAVAVSCLYIPESGDPSQRWYAFSSCSGGPQPGDIVSAAWARLAVANGDATMRLRAQIARRPLGDQLGSEIIPPMPTYWGDEDGCMLQSGGGVVVPASQSCNDAIAEASRIVTGYFDEATRARPAAGWIVAPVPEFAKRHGDFTPDSATPLLAPLGTMATLAPANALVIHEEGHANPGGMFDAYWKLTGGLNYTSFPDSDRALTHLDADFSTHGVFLGADVKVLDVSASADSDTGQTIPSARAASSHAEAHMYLFGLEYPAGGFQSDPSGSFTKTIPLFNQTFDAPPIHFWIFAVKVGLSADAGLDLGGGVSPSGITLSATPQGTIGAHLWGGIDIFVASGGVDVTVDLLAVRAPIAAQASWFLDRSLASCSASIAGSVDADLTVSSGGGHVDLVATFGPCPLCDDESVTLFSWKPLFSMPISVFHQQLALASVPLPASLCTANSVTASISGPSSDFGPVYGTATSIPLAGIAYSNNASGLPTSIGCAYFSWSVDTPGDTISGTGCSARIAFANTPHLATITLTVNHPVTDKFGRQLMETGSAIKKVTVSRAEGARIVLIEELLSNSSIIPGPTSPQLSLLGGPPQGGYLITGTFVAADGTVDPSSGVTYGWTVLHNGVTQDISCAADITHCVFGSNPTRIIRTKTTWDPALDIDQTNGYTITFTVRSTATNALIASSSFDAVFRNLR
jgi:hypothetical protein